MSLPTMIRCTLVCLYIVCCTHYTIAQEPKKLSLQDAVSIGLENSRLLTIDESKIIAAQSKVDEISASRLPALKFQTGYTRLSQVPPFTFTLPFQGSTPVTISPVILDNYVLKLSAAQPVFTGFKLESLEEAAGFSAKATQFEYDKDKNELIYSIKTAYWNLVKAREFKKVAEENVRMIQAHLADIQKMEKAGMVNKNDVLKVQVQVSDAEFKKLEAKNQVQLATLAVNNALRLPITTLLEPTESPSLIENTTAVEDYIVAAQGQRPDIMASEFRIKAGEQGVKAAKSSWYPQVNVFAEYNYNNPNMRIVPARSQFDDTWAAGIQVSMDVWNWGLNTAQTSQAEAQLAQAIDASSLTKEGIAMEVMQSYLLMKQSFEKISVTKSVIEQADENVRVVNLRFNNCNAISTDVTDAELLLFSAKINNVQAIIDFELSKIRLQKAIGKS